MKLRLYNKELNNKYISIDEYIGKEDLKHIQQQAINISKAWSFKNNEDIFKIESIEYGRLYQISLYYHAVSVLKACLLVKKINEINEDVNNIVINNKKEYNIIKKIIKHDNLNIKVKYYRKFKLGVSKSSIKDVIKEMNLDYWIRIISNHFKKTNKINKIDNLFVYEVNNNSMISIINEISKFFTDSISVALCSSKQVINKSNINDKILIPTGFKLKFFLQANNDFKILKQQYNKNKEDIFENFKYDNKTISYLFKGKINSIINYGLSAMCFIKTNIREVLSDYEIKNIILPSDSHTLSRLICMYAAANSIQTIVIQHGSIGKLAFTPIYATYFAAWSEYCKNKLISWGENEKKIKVIGNIKYPSITENINSEIKKYNNLNILWAVNPVGQSLNKKLFGIFNSLLNTEQGLINKLIIKLHPGNEEYEFFNNLKLNCNNSEHIIIKRKSSNIIENILKNDILVITQSTTGLEGMALEKVVFLFDSEELPEIIPYKSYNSVITFKDNFEFIDGIRFLQKTDNVTELNKNSKKLLETYMSKFQLAKFKELIK